MEIFNEFIRMYNNNVILMGITSGIIWLIITLFSKKISYIILRILKVKIKDKKEILEDGFYKPLSKLISLGGLYISIMLLQTPLNFSLQLIVIINKVFKIIATILLAKGIADSLTTKSNFFKKVAEKTEQKSDDSSINLLIKAIKVVIYIIAGFIVILEIGYDLSGLVTGLGIGSIVITLAAQDAAKSLLGGLMIAVDKPFKVGEWISTSAAEGTVEEITFRSTRIRNVQNSIVNVPNSIMAESVVTNASKIKTRRFDARLTLELNTTLEKIKIFEDTVISMLQAHENIISDTIRVCFDKIGDNGFEIAIFAFTNTAEYAKFLQIKEELNYQIMNIVNIQNIGLAYNSQTLYVKH